MRRPSAEQLVGALAVDHDADRERAVLSDLRRRKNRGRRQPLCSAIIALLVNDPTVFLTCTGCRPTSCGISISATRSSSCSSIRTARTSSSSSVKTFSPGNAYTDRRPRRNV